MKNRIAEWRTAGVYVPHGDASQRLSGPPKNGMGGLVSRAPVGRDLLSSKPVGGGARHNHAAAYRWVLRGYKKGLPLPRNFTTCELFRVRRERLSRQLTPLEIWFIHTSGDPASWLAEWFRLSVSAVRKLQASPNEGSKWTKAQLAELSPMLANYVQKR